MEDAHSTGGRPVLAVSRAYRELGRQRRPSDDDARVRIRRGVHMSQVEWEAADPVERHLVRMHAIAETRRVDAVFSHVSAAVIHGIPLLDRPGGIVHAITEPETRRRASGIAWHRRHLDGSQIERRDGLLVTSLTDTLLDLARSESFASAVVSLDAVLGYEAKRPRWDSRAGVVERAELEACLESLAGASGIRRARHALAFADGRAESVGESLSRVQMYAWGLPIPDLHVEVVGASGQTWRADFRWDRGPLVGEFDGRIKYGRDLDGADTGAEAVWREKQREDDLRACGESVVCWVWRDALDGARLVDALGRYGLETTRRRPRPVFTKGTQ